MAYNSAYTGEQLDSALATVLNLRHGKATLTATANGSATGYFANLAGDTDTGEQVFVHLDAYHSSSSVAGVDVKATLYPGCTLAGYENPLVVTISSAAIFTGDTIVVDYLILGGS